MGYIIFFIFLAGCITNPKLTDKYYDKQVRENPQFEDQIRADQKAYQREWAYQQLNGSKVISNLNYTVRDYKKGSFGVGGRDSVFWLGYENVDYLHEIVVTIVCNDHEVPPLRSRFSYKPITWKISEKYKGAATTNANGVVQINLETEDSKKFENLKIIYKNRVYNVPLQGPMVLEVEPDYCKKTI